MISKNSFNLHDELAAAGSVIHPSHYELSITLSDDFYNDKTNGNDVLFNGSLTIHCNISNSDDVEHDTILSSIELDCNSDRVEILGVSIEKNKNKLKGVVFEQLKRTIAVASSSDSGKKKNKEKRNETKSSNSSQHSLSEQNLKRKGLMITSPIEPLNVGKYEIKISFKGLVVPAKKAMSGLFYSVHPKIGSKILCSHFEAQFAHYVFPCFDDWEEKATFQLSVSNLHSNFKCISNTTPKTKNDSKKTITFNTTPKMSIYLVGLFIGQFECIETEFTSNLDGIEIPISVNYLESTSLIVENAKTVLGMSCKILPILENYFDSALSKQQISKIDWIIIPDLIIGGGMENWGCITLLEKHTANSAMDMKKLGPFVEILSHELSHFWVGNLVGFPFHIKEGLALYLEQIVTDEVLKRPSSLSTKKNSTEKRKDLVSEIKQGNEHLSVEQAFSKMFSGVAYTQCFDWICTECVGTLGSTTFRDRLRQLISENEFGFVNEKDFKKVFK
ncbi:hypothetical protein FDP41_010839 [Naegleria fowleri]|uniref:Peptidase M1 membrane alanine aminopeptidase domain-containing protein n=1 Tax=Naegleria fowleri TaxID=5763 RepID=A0A6A5CB28_NAEFO|nr:uncharacterized protein FDP41_010839 [Naegleria fowleri]KAF0982860.1 hypothetical protein FDP41_010839 [Naegleria fowleri]